MLMKKKMTMIKDDPLITLASEDTFLFKKIKNDDNYWPHQFSMIILTDVWYQTLFIAVKREQEQDCSSNVIHSGQV